MDDDGDAPLELLDSGDSQLPRTQSHDGISEDVVSFGRRHNLMHKLKVFEKAAALLQTDTSPDELPNITATEVEALDQENHRRWNQPWTLYLTIFMCSLGAIEQGMAQTSMNGANLYFPAQLGIGNNTPRDNFIVGLINSGMYLSIGIFGATGSVPINLRFGRRGAIFFASILCLVSNIGCALSQNWQTLLAFRVLLGAGLGINISTISVYAAESAPAYIRGGLATSWQMFTAFGIFLGFVANLAVYSQKDPWRSQLAIPIAPVVPLIAGIFLCPESPAWLANRKGRLDLAFLTLCRLRNTELQAAKEVYATEMLSRNKFTGKSKTTFINKLRDMILIPRVRNATVAAYVVQLSQQLCGINIIAFYSSVIFSDAGFSTYGALFASTIFGFLNFIGAFPAVWAMDSLGRRSLLLLTLPFMAVTMLTAGLSFDIPKDNQAHLGVLATMIYLFCVEYSPGMGPVPAAYCAEVFPASHREVGVSFSVTVASFWSSLLSLTFPAILATLGARNTFVLYAGFNVLALILVFFLVPETRLKSLDELDEVFEVSMIEFAKYQTAEYLPWWTRRYVLRQKGAELGVFRPEDEYTRLDPGHNVGETP
ncbi:MFS transporter [Tothia fuscella]|uniref:MFS transporter n=1 Tax=Tothia fuscella TaxID=1048955 RepID=A0A9P4NVZ5_9PEZI|nr:MFS transporter [Tothia fuscella]